MKPQLASRLGLSSISFRYSMPDGSTYGVLFRESAFRKFKAQLANRPEITHVWLVTDSEEAFAEMCSNCTGSA